MDASNQLNTIPNGTLYPVHVEGSLQVRGISYPRV